MRKLLQVIGIAFALLAVWFVVWYFVMAPHVARVEASLKYHNARQKTYGAFKPVIEVKYDAVYATGFPFKFQVAVDRPTLSMIYLDETFAASLERVTLENTDSTQGRYRVNLPSEAEAFYAKNNGTPEHYNVSASPVPGLLLSATDAKVKCGPMSGKACEPVAEDAPLVSYAIGVPKAISLHMELNGQTRDENFPLSPIEITVPIFRTIPDDLSTPLEIFVRVLREGLVYKTPSETKQ